MKIKRPVPFQSVQWFSDEEWKYVFNLIYGPESNDERKRTALQILLVWKSRNPYLPSGIESTLGLLEVDLQYPTDNSTPLYSDRLLRHMYSTAVMRFINHTLDDAQQKKFTLFQAAINLDIPQWIIDLRHETAHGHELPSLEMLRNAAQFAMNWLFTAYWEPKSKTISNYVVSKDLQSFRDDIYKLITMHNLIIACMHPSLNIKNLSSIPDEELKSNLYEDLESVLKSKIPKKIKLIDAQNRLLEVLETYIDENKHLPNFDETFSKLLTDVDSLFMDVNLGNFENWNNILWEPILTLMQKKYLISALVIELLEIVNSNETHNNRRKCAALWLKHILSALNKYNVFKKIVISNSNNTEEKLMELVPVITQKLREENGGIILNLRQSVPHEISNPDFIKSSFKLLNPYLNLYARELLALSNPKISNKLFQKLLKLVELLFNPKAVNISDQVFTVNDFEKLSPQSLDLSSFEESYANLNQPNAWKLYSGDCEWDKCPIGLLPWQKPNKNPLL